MKAHGSLQPENGELLNHTYIDTLDSEIEEILIKPIQTFDNFSN